MQSTESRSTFYHHMSSPSYINSFFGHYNSQRRNGIEPVKARVPRLPKMQLPGYEDDDNFRLPMTSSGPFVVGISPPREHILCLRTTITIIMGIPGLWEVS
jgi:hypothetical protein